jgi:glycosyltransferase involved in cell wall biosynthesis
VIDIVMISSGKRRNLLIQALTSFANGPEHGTTSSLTLVYDGFSPKLTIGGESSSPHLQYIISSAPRGASASRNYGASSIPKYRRGKYVLFLDDDVYLCPGWDVAMIKLAEAMDGTIVSGHAHPFNGSEAYMPVIGVHAQVPLVISSVCMMMQWSLWDKVGYFDEPGGPGGSEDYEFCMRAKADGYRFAVTDPQCVIHCGLTSTSGRRIVGYEQMVEHNKQLIAHYNLQGKVHYE